MLNLLLVEDSEPLRRALRLGLEETGAARVSCDVGSGEEALANCLGQPPDVILMDVRLAGVMNGIEAAVAIRREFPRLPVVFYSIQDDDEYFRDFRRSGILSHYAYVRKSNYLLPRLIVPLLRDAVGGRSFIDPEIESRVQEVRQKDEQSPMALLEPNEQAVARMLSQGLSNEQIAARLGFRDKRTISRTNGQIYAAWGLGESATDEKIARTRAAIILREGRLLQWDGDGVALALNARGDWVRYEPLAGPVSPHLVGLGLYWALLALAFFNTIALLWLGLAVLLNAERRTWGVWLAGGGLAAGGLYLAAFAVLIGRDNLPTPLGIQAWARLIWVPFLGAPYLWYLVMAWYTRQLGDAHQRVVLVALTVLGALVMALLLGTQTLPYDLGVGLPTLVHVSDVGIGVVVAPYLGYSLLCLGASLLALRRPGAAERFMGDLARRRARPWLVAAALALVALSIAVATAPVWLFSGGDEVRTQVLTLPLLGLAVLVSALVAAAIVLTGRAVVSYEIFTGKTLPRGGLVRQWRNSLILAAGFGGLVGGSLVLPIDSVYRALTAALLVTLFLALLNWRSYLERERGMDRLRPFVASQRLYERLLRVAAPPEVDAATPFRALCDDVLGASRAYLVALGPLAPLAGPSLVHPPGLGEAPPPSGLAAQVHAPDVLCVPIEPAHYGGAAWAVPLWSERGLIGMLLLGEKRDGGVYTQEEIEIARATGERLIDSQASAEMGRRLMQIQRDRLAETQVLDRRARSVLHDDVLPRLHTALLSLSRGAGGGASEATLEALSVLAEAHSQISNLLRETSPAVPPDVAQLGFVAALRKALDGDLGAQFESVSWRADPIAEEVAQMLPALSGEVLYGAAREAIRNAARHGRGEDAVRPLHLTVGVRLGAGLEIEISDDGVGVDAAVASEAGSGRGLALHSTMMAVIGGTLTVETARGAATRVVLALPGAGLPLGV